MEEKTLKNKVEIGDIAPDFSLPDKDNKVHQLSDYREQKIALYFYPRNHTPHCTSQACSIRDNFDDLKAHNIKVIGINFNSPEDHQSFTADKKLPFLLLSDRDKKIATLYNATRRLFLAIIPRRITFLIDESGTVVDIITKADVDNFAQQIIKRFEAVTAQK